MAGANFDTEIAPEISLGWKKERNVGVTTNAKIFYISAISPDSCHRPHLKLAALISTIGVPRGTMERFPNTRSKSGGSLSSASNRAKGKRYAIGYLQLILSAWDLQRTSSLTVQIPPEAS
jgi:hypothetical protein